VDRTRRRYLIDTDVLALIQERADADDLYAGIGALAHADTVRTVRQVFDELKRFPQPQKKLQPFRAQMVVPPEQQFAASVSERIEILGNKASYLWEQTGGRNPDPADPWLIAVASAFDYTLVTNENPRATSRIPAACRLPGINCRVIRGPHFLYEVELLRELKPAHIHPSDFFRRDA